MIKNYLVTTFRNFFRHKIFSGITVLGLSIGISASLVLFLIVQHEFGYDKFEPGNDRIYRVVLDAKFNGHEGHSAAVPAPLGSVIQNEITGVEQTAPILQFQGDATANVSILKTGVDNPVVFKKQPSIVFTNDQYFYIVPYKWISGSPENSLLEPFSVVLSESRAQQYFPSMPVQDIIGKQITYNDDINVTVSGIVKDIEETTAFESKEFISHSTIAKTNLQNRFMMTVWNDWMAYSSLYVKLANGTKTTETESLINTMYAKYNKNARKDESNYISFHLQPLQDIHFNYLYSGFGFRVVHKPTLYGLLAIAAFLLLLGCINFINLTTANASNRAKEIGIRKTMGSSKAQLVFRFLGETFFATVIATIISVLMVPLLLQMFHDFIPPGLDFNLLNKPSLLIFLFVLVIIVSFLSGVYPALVLSGYKPVAVLKNQVKHAVGETKHVWVRKTLIVSQFVIAQFFIIATLIVSKQINHSMNADLGFAKDGIITIETPRKKNAGNSIEGFMNKIKAIPEIEVASEGFLSPADLGAAYTNVSYLPKKDVQAQVQIRWGSPDYFDVYKLKLLAGRKPEPSDSMREFVINNTYAKLLDFQNPDDAIGKQLEFNGKQIPIVGVMQDFHDVSTHGMISPLVFAGNSGTSIHVRFKPIASGEKTWQNGIAKINKAYKEIYPEAEFKYSFYDETIAKMYTKEAQTSTLLKWATGFSIFISCLGLLGLVLFTINTKIKEIGIRKVLGASVTSIVSYLSKDFLRLVLLAFIIATPIAWWAMFKWLGDFAYRTDLSWWIFAVSGAMMLILAVATLCIQTIRAAIQNPVKSLRTE